ncbi:P-loop NTPase fold protein [Ruegeria arenilitoris]|uniref:P-loop NTPase fold protein n=1 Tax=Ruegeria arenilitoris TaxID=1173585 RepID=UPI00147AEADB|nr:P-loop NTPase fold protein [Ruegeria arenilitoris]
MTDLNASTRAYLQQYLSSPEPGFAVLLTAPWGAGKTHLVRSLLTEDNPEKPLYVSLFGIGNRDELEKALVRAFLPKSDSDVAKAGKQLRDFISGIKAFGFSVDLTKIDLTEFVIAKLPNALIFDDIERAKMPVKEVLGAVNGFVEHEGKHVVLLANEEGLWDNESIKEKEKVVGRTLTVVADVDSALGPIFSAFSGPSKSFFAEEAETITDVFRKAGYNNLRSLKQVLWEFERLLLCLDETIRENPEGMQELLTVFVALALELKSGNFTRDDMRLRGGMDINNKPEYAKLREARAKYGLEQIQHGRYQTVLPHLLAEKVLCDGEVDRGTINTVLAQTPAFHQPAAESEWETVWWALDREEDAVAAAIRSMEHNFSEREYLEPGVILHVFSCRLSLSEMGFAEKDLPEIEAECAAYIDDLVTSDRLREYDPVADFNNESGYGYSDRSFRNLGFPRGGNDPRSESFNRLYEKLQSAQYAAFEKSLPAVGQQILKVMKTDVQEFYNWIAVTNTRQSVYARLPVLAAINPSDFAASILDLRPDHRRKAFYAVSKRYEFSGAELESEKPWLKAVHEELQQWLNNTNHFQRWQVGSEVNQTFGKIFQRWAEAEAEAS